MNVLLHTKAKVDGMIVPAGKAVAVPDYRGDRMIKAGHAEKHWDGKPIDTMRMTWITPSMDIKVKGEVVRAGVAVEVPGQRADKLVSNGKARVCDAPIKVYAKPKTKKGEKKDEGKETG